MSIPLTKKSNKPNTIPEPGSEAVADLHGSNTALKEEILRWILSITCAIVLYAIAAIILSAVYEPDVEWLHAVARERLIRPEIATPEPMEALLFRLGAIITIPSLLGFYALFSKTGIAKKLAAKPAFSIISLTSVALVAALIFIGFAAPNSYDAAGKPLSPDGPAQTNFAFYFSGFFIGEYLWVYALLLVPATEALFLIGLKKKHWDSNAGYNKATLVTGYAISGATVVAILFMNTFVFPYSPENKFDFNAVYYSMAQVYAGSPMLVDGFTNTYGLYPHFLNPLFQLIGLSVFNFSLVMSLLVGACFVLNFLVLKKFVRNNVILFLGFTTILFFSYLLRKIDKFDCFFSFFPIRYIIPSVCLYLSVLHFSRPSARVYWAAFVALGFFVLWNPEIGIVTYLSWVAANVYNDFYNAGGKINKGKILQHLLAGICMLPLAFYTWKLLVYVFYGVAPDLSLLWSAMFVFGKVGFNLLPMALAHPWNLVALIIIIGFMYAISCWHKKAVTPRSSSIFLLSLISLGYLFYFQGRSHNSNLALTSGFCIMLLTLLGDELWQTLKTRNILALNALFALFIFLVSFSVFELCANANKLYNLAYQEEDKQKQAQEQEFVEKGKDLLLSYTAEGEKVHFLGMAKQQGLYFDGTKRRSAFNPGMIDLFFKSDLERCLGVLRDSSFSVFIEPSTFSYAYLQPVTATIAALYEAKGHSPTIAFLKKRQARIPARSFFADTAQVVVHRKYSDNPSGIDMRIQDASGTEPITLAPAFSVQTLFYSSEQIYPYPALISNYDEKKGFIIGGVFNSNNYLFGINKVSLKVPVKHNQWSYAVMNVFPDRFDVYINGVLAASRPLEQPIMESGGPLFIGNYDKMHFFVGAISEVSVINNVLDKTQIENTWAEISRETAARQ
jgi:hypothetical protein